MWLGFRPLDFSGFDLACFIFGAQLRSVVLLIFLLFCYNAFFKPGFRFISSSSSFLIDFFIASNYTLLQFLQTLTFLLIHSEYLHGPRPSGFVVPPDESNPAHAGLSGLASASGASVRVAAEAQSSAPNVL